MSSCAGIQTGFDHVEISEKNYNLNKVLILHLGSIDEQRQLIENTLSSWFDHYGYNVQPSNQYFEEETLPGKLELANLLKDQDFEAILITRLEKIEAGERYINTERPEKTDPEEPLFYMYLDTYSDRAHPLSTNLGHAYVVRTQLFTVTGSKWIYDSVTQPLETATYEQAIDDFTKSIAYNLHQSGLLEKEK